jgi:hypothetical protein
LCLVGRVASHSFNAAFMRVCQPGPLARNAPTTSRSRRIATCSLAGFFPGPRVRRSVPIVAATPPPGVTTPLLQSILRARALPRGVAAPVRADSQEGGVYIFGSSAESVGKLGRWRRVAMSIERVQLAASGIEGSLYRLVVLGIGMQERSPLFFEE